MIRDKSGQQRPAEDVVRDIKKAQLKPPGEDYREKSLLIHGLVCARCGRGFDHLNRHLLTVHHKDGNHHNNPADGSNWENLCVYCHENEHSRGILGDYLEGTSQARDEALVYKVKAEGSASPLGSLGEKLKKALDKKLG
ncbi:MAG: YajD family HNH nuclease [Syntrophales bacterium LBB04]|nr:YajD family HNH nuclease [Syntrophales bacterium LBB04]